MIGLAVWLLIGAANAVQPQSQNPSRAAQTTTGESARAPQLLHDTASDSIARQSLALARRGSVVSVVALLLAAASAGLTVLFWLQTYRPIVTARIETYAHGNQGIFLNLVVENSGTRPARDVQLVVTAEALDAAFDPKLSEDNKDEVRACFSPEWMIPILANQGSVSNAFGVLASDGSVNRRLNTWKWHCRLPVEIRYRGLGQRSYRERMDLFLADTTGFASVSWGEK